MARNSGILVLLLAPLLALPLRASADPVYAVTPIVNAWNGVNVGGSATTMNNFGVTAGMYSTQSTDWQAATYSNGTLAIQRPAGYVSGSAFGINDAGTVLARLCTSQSSCRYGTIADGVLTPLPGAFTSYSNSWYGTSPINSSGQVTGALESGNGMYAFLSTPGGGTVDLGFGGMYSWGRAVNDGGAVAGWYQDDDYIRHAVSYSNGVVHELSAPGSYSEANDLNNAGVAVGMQASTVNDQGQAVMFVNGQVVELGDRATWDGGYARAINNAGTVVGEAYLHDSGATAFVYRDGAMYYLNDLVAPGWVVGTAWNVNDSGQILAEGTSPDGVSQFLLLTPTGVSPVPEPDHSLALFTGLLVIGASFRCQRQRQVIAA